MLGKIVVVNDRGDPPGSPAKMVVASTGKVGRVVRGAQGPELLGSWTVTLSQEAPPIGVSFRPESLSMPEKE